jgi:hypothetical protein
MSDLVQEVAAGYDGAQEYPTEISMAVLDADTVACLNDKREIVSLFKRVPPTGERSLTVRTTARTRPWRSEEIKALRAHAMRIPDPYDPAWAEYLPKRDGHAIERMMVSIGIRDCNGWPSINRREAAAICRQLGL